MNNKPHVIGDTPALIIFTRNPELGKCKTRLAKSIGDKAALEVYRFLLKRTAQICSEVNADRFVFYSEHINENDIWDNSIFNKKLQKGNDLGQRMYNAFLELFSLGYTKVLIVGSDLLDLEAIDIETAIHMLSKHDIVVGPAEDGGYYLLGMKTLHSEIFNNKAWGTETVLKNTLEDLYNDNVFQLKLLNDIDTFEDLEGSPYYKLNKKIQNIVLQHD